MKSNDCNILGSIKRGARFDDDSDTSSILTRTSTPIMLDFYEPPDPYVPAAEWAVVNVSGQRFHINMKHIKEYHKGRKCQLEQILVVIFPNGSH